jgi:hypothetical protein
MLKGRTVKTLKWCLRVQCLYKNARGLTTIVIRSDDIKVAHVPTGASCAACGVMVGLDGVLSRRTRPIKKKEYDGKR